MKKTKLFALIMAGLLTSSSFFTGCGSKADTHGLDADNPITITVWHYYNGVQQISFDEMVNEFNETVGAENGIIVEAYTKSTIAELADSVISSLNKEVGADDAPDIFASYAETAFVVDNMDMAVDLNNYFTEDEKKQYMDSYISEGEFNAENEFVIMPTAKSTEIMLMNYTDWESFADAENVTEDELKTWEGVAEVAEKYYNYTDALTPDIENDGKAFFGRDSVANYMIVGSKQLGSEIFEVTDGKFKANLDKDVMKRLWENYYVPYVKGYYAARGRYRSDDAKVGTIIAAVGSTTGASYFPSSVTVNDDYSYPIETIVLPVPNFENSEDYMVQQGAGMVVTKSDESHEYASAVFLKWFTEAERNIEFSVNSGYLPVKKDACNIDEIHNVVSEKDDEINDILMKSIEVAVDDINQSELYSARPFENAESARDFVGNEIQECADADYAEICERIENGENRDDVIAEYVSDEAFEKWYNDFTSGLGEIVSIN